MAIKKWEVTVHSRVIKAMKQLPNEVYDSLFTLVREIKESGPVRVNWKHYSKLGNNRHHCHIKTGKPTYVAVWEEVKDKVRLVEVTYVGTHEKAPY